MEKISLIVLLLLALVFTFIAIYIGRIFGISSSNPVKKDPYECGIETKGVTWVQFNIGYYLFALLFLIFDVEIVFLYPLVNLCIGYIKILRGMFIGGIMLKAIFYNFNSFF